MTEEPSRGIVSAFEDPAFLAEWNRMKKEEVALWESLVEDSRTLGRKGWTVPMWMLPTHLLFITRTFSHDLDAVFTWAYSAQSHSQFSELATGLQRHPMLERWRPLIRQAASSYRRRQYLLVVPALLSVLDGLVALVGDRLAARSDPKRIVDEEVRDSPPGIQRHVWVSIQSFLHEVFRPHDFASPPPLSINRHWILHGRELPHWGRADCLRLFQALDTISAHAGLQKRDPLSWLSEEFRRSAPPELLAELRRGRAV